MFKKTIALMTLIFFAQAVCMTPEHLALCEQQTSAGPLSDENQAFIHSIKDRIPGVIIRLEIRKPLETYIESSPICMFECCAIQNGIWYINESWFNTLSEEEKTYIIAFRLLLKPATSYTLSQKIIKYLPKTIGGIVEVAFVIGMYKYLRSYPHLGKFENSIVTSGILSFVSLMVVSGLAIDPLIHYVEQKNNTSFATQFATQHDVLVVQQFNCLEGALSVLKKMVATIEPLLVHDKEYWKEAYDLYTMRIAALEQFKKAQS